MPTSPNIKAKFLKLTDPNSGCSNLYQMQVISTDYDIAANNDGVNANYGWNSDVKRPKKNA